MPPGRANYQQRSGRAGRRGNAVATVVAFGSADSHDEHYFTEPDGMIRGDVVDPKLTLDNREIVRRHVRAFLLQNYHQDRLPVVDPSQRHDLFSVLGTVSEFRNGTSVLNRDDFAAWLSENGERLRDRVASWIPAELSPWDRESLLAEMTDDCLEAVDDAIRPGPGESDAPSETGDDTESEDVPEEGEERPQQASRPGKLLDRLLYCGKLPRYAFPTDVATFHHDPVATPSESSLAFLHRRPEFGQRAHPRHHFVDLGLADAVAGHDPFDDDLSGPEFQFQQIGRAHV